MARKSAKKSSASSDTARATRRRVSMRSRNESAGGRLRRTSRSGSGGGGAGGNDDEDRGRSSIVSRVGISPLLTAIKGKCRANGHDGGAFYLTAPTSMSTPAWSIVRRRPSCSGTLGSQPSSSRARVMSGWRTFGSSTGSAS